MRGAIEPRGIAALQAKRGPDFVSGVGKAELRGHHADHFEGLAIEARGAADHVGAAAEFALPERLAEDYDLVRAAFVLSVAEIAAEHRMDTEDVEKIRRDAERE